jgi:trehalose/maltose hydrolase-like predicted phosphorylase
MVRRAIPLLLIGALGAVLAGCPAGPPDQPVQRPNLTPAPIRVSGDPWVLASTAWEPDSRGAYLANGLLGQRLFQAGAARAGEPADAAFAAGLYYNESLVTLPPLLPLRLESAGRVFGADPGHLKAYRQELRLRRAALQTRATWESGAGDVEVLLEAMLLRHRPEIALLRIRIANRGTQPITAAAPVPGLGGDEPLLWSAGEPLSVSETRAYGGRRITWRRSLAVLGGGGSVGRGDQGHFTATVPAGETADLALVTRVGGLPGFPDAPLPRLDAAQVEAWTRDHHAAWEELWARDIEVDGDAEAQQAVRACLYQLLASVRADCAAGVPPMGLSAAAFNGHVFWDMDSWMLPAVLPQHPDLARAMLDYRIRTLPGARANAKAEGLPGAAYAWESASTGKETLLTEVFRHGRHVSGAVALAAKQYYEATQDRAWLRQAWPMLEATADNWAARAQPDGKGGLVIKGVTTPDELAGRVDHSAWTHHVAQVNLRFAGAAAGILGERANPKWEQTARGLGFLRDPATGLILPYAGFTEKTKAKQADVLLLAHPGEAALEEAELGRMYDHYAPRVITTGPAMTDAIHAVVAARLGRGDEALARFRAAYQPFARPPYMLFSEKRTRDNLAFLTGAAGVVEAVVYGFAGLQPRTDPQQKDRPQVRPHLPPGWSAVRLRGVQWRGRSWDLEVTDQGARWSPAPPQTRAGRPVAPPSRPRPAG